MRHERASIRAVFVLLDKAIVFNEPQNEPDSEDNEDLVVVTEY